jgi:hypothetical protein
VIVFAFGVLIAAGSSACARVRPWERGALADAAMNPNAPQTQARREFPNHVLDVREGSTGGVGTAGGGCGCN